MKNNKGEALSKLSYVRLETVDGKIISIELLHVKEAKIGNHIVEVRGKSYDIFATPNYTTLML